MNEKRVLKFKKELYTKVALIKAAYNFTNIAYVHLDADDTYYYVSIEEKSDEMVSENDFVNEMLTQSVRHEVYNQTKNIRELMLARTLCTSVVMQNEEMDDCKEKDEDFLASEILKDWFEENENIEVE